MLVETVGSATPDEVWHRYTTPDTWPEWAPHLRGVETDAAVIEAGVTGRVLGPRGVWLDFTIEDVDPVLRSWSWRVGRGSRSVRMHHDVIPAAGGRTRATLRLEGALSLAMQPYRLLAGAALRGLVSGSPGPRADQVRAFAFAFAPTYAIAGRFFGITPHSTTVEVGPQWFYVRYGPWRLLTPRSNIAGTEVTEDFTWVKTAGPPHLSLVDRGVSFTTNGERALCVSFHEPVPAIDPSGTILHPGATIAVSEPEALASALADH